MEFLMRYLKQARTAWPNYYYMHTRIERVWEKLEQYYKITDASVTYTAATVLNPVYKWQ